MLEGNLRKISMHVVIDKPYEHWLLLCIIFLWFIKIYLKHLSHTILLHLFTCSFVAFSRLQSYSFIVCIIPYWSSLVAQLVKNLTPVWETWFRSLDWEDPLEEGMATLSSILTWRIPWTEETRRLQSMGLQRVRHDWTSKHTTLP